jgi:hypothetical protein
MPTKAPVKKTIRSPQKPVKKTVKKTAKKVTWDEIQEGFKKLQELHRETERTLNNAISSTEKTLNESFRNTEKTLNKAIGGLSNTLGSLVEHIMTPGLPQKFKQLGFSFNRIASYKYAEGVYAEIDALLENGTQAVVVEVKTTLRHDDIDDHLNRMEKVRKYADEHGDKRQFMGAIAATITDESTREYALKKGLFIIEPSGENVKVTKPSTEPRIW